MALEFEFYELPDSSGENKERYYARPVSRGTIDTDRIITDIHSRSTLTRGDAKAALICLSDMLVEYLWEGHSVHIEGIGFFQVSLKCSPDINPKKAHAQSVKFKAVKFRADKRLNEQLKHLRGQRAEIKVHSEKLTDKEIGNRLKKFFNENKYLSRKDFQQICGFTQATAARQLVRLRESRKIKNIHTAQHPLYILMPESTNDMILNKDGER